VSRQSTRLSVLRVVTVLQSPVREVAVEFVADYSDGGGVGFDESVNRDSFRPVEGPLPERVGACLRALIGAIRAGRLLVQLLGMTIDCITGLKNVVRLWEPVEIVVVDVGMTRRRGEVDIKFSCLDVGVFGPLVEVTRVEEVESGILKPSRSTENPRLSRGEARTESPVVWSWFFGGRVGLNGHPLFRVVSRTSDKYKTDVKSLDESRHSPVTQIQRERPRGDRHPPSRRDHGWRSPLLRTSSDTADVGSPVQRRDQRDRGFLPDESTPISRSHSGFTTARNGR